MNGQSCASISPSFFRGPCGAAARLFPLPSWKRLEEPEALDPHLHVGGFHQAPEQGSAVLFHGYHLFLNFILPTRRKSTRAKNCISLLTFPALLFAVCGAAEVLTIGAGQPAMDL
jgi:hypothetical protein